MTMQAFVARERELAQLQTFLDRALAGHGHVCFVTGEAGSGKTALVREFARRAQEQYADLLVAIGDCNAQTGIGDPYLPFREVLGLLTGDVEARLARGAITPENAGRLRDFLRVSGQALVEYGPDLIDIFVPGGALATRVAGRLARRTGWLERLEELTQRKAAGPGETGLEQSHIFEQYTDVLKALAAQRPLMLIVDDLQWADVSSISLLFHLGRRIGESRILLVGAYRAEDVALGRGGERHPLEDVVSEFKRYYGDVWVELGQAAEGEGRQFVEALLDSEPNRLGEGFRQALFQHTGGHALFTIELLRDLQERGDLVQDEEGRWVEGPTLDWGKLPARVEGVIEKRIGRLEAGLREALRVASVEGEDFTAQVVAHVQELPERRLLRALSQELQKRHRLVQEWGEVTVGRRLLSVYRFAHALFQQYLYHDLSAGERRLLHGEIGRVLEELYGEQVEEIAVQLARHFQMAGITEKAVDYLLQAGQRALRLSAYGEAIAHLSRGLELLNTLPDTPEQTQRELSLQIALGNALMATQGFGAPEVGKAYGRARELCRSLGEMAQLLPVLGGLWQFYLVRAEYQTARELAEQLLSVAHQAQDPALLVAAHTALGQVLLSVGELVPAHAHLEQGIALYDPRQHHSLALLLGGEDPGVSCRGCAAWTLWLLGYPDRALKQTHEAFSLAQELTSPLNLAAALGTTAWLHQFRREGQTAQERAEDLITLSAEQGFALMVAVGTIVRGWALAEQGQPEAGIAQIRQGLAAYRATGAAIALPTWLALLAEAYGQMGRPEEGLSVLSEALTAVGNTGERRAEAELYRLQGELLLMQGGRGDSRTAPTEAETCFRQAIEVARRQQTKSWELRATVSLCRLLQQQGRGEEGQQMLAEVYGWFTEGFDTPDLIEAKALLEALSQ